MNIQDWQVWIKLVWSCLIYGEPKAADARLADAVLTDVRIA